MPCWNLKKRGNTYFLRDAKRSHRLPRPTMEQIKISSPDHPASNTIEGFLFCWIIILSVKVGKQPNGVPSQGHDLAAIKAGRANAKRDCLAETILDAPKRFACNGIESDAADS